ncbi:hypothetical protein G7Y89_g15485 [Cudoniella acicularis]|uniref:Uncharacterized protein n=1 Tax=Cudoniella acicularis TaxID=354080 RepID=A0A8H4QMA3_9HELO|nr:hypothetical protein G7Y89_g15485 [Cudoniella acicularis]
MDLVTVPRNALIPAIGNLSLTDLRMMHHWSTATWDKLTIGPENSKVLLNHVTSLAFESDFLLNCILGISSLHKEHLLPDSQAQKNQTAIYRVKALNGFREALARISLDSLNWEAALIMAILIIILCSKDYDRGEVEDELSIIKWLVLYRGVSSIISMKSYTEVLATGVHPIFRCELVPLTITPATPRSLLRLVENIDILDPDFECRSSYCGMLNALSTLYGSLKQNGLCDDLFIRTITLASHGSQQFCVVSREKRPRPLIILAHLLIFIKLISNRLWWLKGMSDKEITAIARIVGPEWLSYLEVPIAATKTTDKAEIVKLLMS